MSTLIQVKTICTTSITYRSDEVFLTRAAVPAQLALVLFAFAALALAPPADGLLWLVPLGREARGAVLRLAVARGGRLVATGPGGSLVVAGERARLWRDMLAAGVVTLAAPDAACSAPPADGA